MDLPLNPCFQSGKWFDYRLIFSILLVLSFAGAIGQPTTYNLPPVIKPSPQSQAFTRYGDYPMTDYTGLTDITIPLHTVNGRKLSLPVTMSFHASGRMAGETNGTLGMRWTLNCGGLVTRTIKGAPDEWKVLTSYTVNPDQEPSFDDLYSACPDGKVYHDGIYFPAPRYDSEFDIFEYVLPNGKSGHFILKNQNGVKVPMLIPYEPLKIELMPELSGNGYFQSIKITDVDGTGYFFGKIDASTGSAVETSDESDRFTWMVGNVPTAWYLTKIVSSDGTDEISLSYNTRYIAWYTATQSANISDQIRDNSTDLYDANGLDAYESNLKDFLVTYHFDQTDILTNIGSPSTIVVPTLSAIQFNGGSVSFSYATIPNQIGNDQLLTEMIINRESVPYKRIKFNTVRHALESDMYYLDDVSFYGDDPNVINEKYAFNYYEPLNQMEDIYASAAYKDWWGYLRPTVFNLLPQQSVNISPIPSNGSPVSRDVGFVNVSRDPDEASKKVGMLKTIIYPTGGQTEFVYEENRYAGPYYQPGYSAALLYGPGLRIKEVISKPVQGSDIHKIYKYGMYEDGRGFINEYLKPGSTSRTNLMEADGNVMHFWSFIPPGSEAEGDPVQAGYRTRDYFSDPYIVYDFPGSPIKYDAVSEYYIKDEIPQQKTTSSYSLINNGQSNDGRVKDFIINDHNSFNGDSRKFADPQDAWITPVLTNKAFYKYSDDQFDLIKNESYLYGPPNMQDEAWDMPTYLHTNVVYVRGLAFGGSPVDENYNVSKDYHENYCSVYGYGFRKYISGVQELLKTTTEEFTPNGMITTEKNIDYEPIYRLVSKEEIVNSKKETIKTTYKYPHDFINTPVYQQLVQKHILSPIIEQSAYKDGSFLNSVTTNYKDWGGEVLAPETVVSKKGVTDPITRLHYYAYDDKGNISSVAKENDVKQSYVWGYDKKYPIAEVSNANANEVFFDSFEDAGTWAGITRDNTMLHTGLYSAKISKPEAGELYYSSTKTLQVVLASATKFKYSGWIYTDGPGAEIVLIMKTATETNDYTYKDVKSVTTANKWIYVEGEYEVPSSITQLNIRIGNNGGGTVWYDDIRLYPSAATMKTYAYLPLIGMTSTTDENNRTTFYQYDNFGRLSQILDNDYNILKKICYDYTGQPGDCSTILTQPTRPRYLSAAIDGNYYSENCGTGSDADPYWVSVPAGMFVSATQQEADAQAQAYAQNQANVYGNCEEPDVAVQVYNYTGSFYYADLYNRTTGITYYLDLSYSDHGTIKGYFPSGEYDVTIYSDGGSSSRDYTVFCTSGTQDIGSGGYTIYDVPLISPCNTIELH